MKSLKFDHELAQAVQRGEKTSTMRIRDDKNLSVNDAVLVIDKTDPQRPETWRVIGTARLTRILEKHLSDVVEIGIESPEGHYVPQDMLTEFREYYDNDVSLSTSVKFIYFDFSSDITNIDVLSTTKNVQKLSIFADGGSRGNPGPSASGFVVIDPVTETVLVDKGIYIGITTNNQAEYLALKYALEEAVRMGARELDVHMDSMLVVNQLKGIFKVRNRDLWPVHEAVKALMGQFSACTVTHVPREMNRLADAAVNRTLDEALKIERPGHIAG